MSGAQKQTGRQSVENILISSGAFAGGGALAASVLNYLKKRRDDKKRRSLTDAMVQSDMPIVRIDPDVTDTSFEEGLDQAGLDVGSELHKVSQLKNDPTPPPVTGTPLTPPPSAGVSLIMAPTVGLGMIGGTMLDQAVSASPDFIRKPLEWLADPDKPSWAAPAAVAASLAAAYGGYRGMDWLMNKIEKDDIDYGIRRKKNLLQMKVNQLLREKYGDANKVAAICSDAAALHGSEFNGFAITKDEYRNIEAEVDAYLGFDKVAEVARQTPATQYTYRENVDTEPSYRKGMREAASIYVLLAAGLTGLSYSLSKGYFDKKSHRRKRLKDLEDNIRRRAVSGDAPMLIDADFNLDTAGSLKPGANVHASTEGIGNAPAGVEPVVEAVQPGVIADSAHSPKALHPPRDAVPLPPVALKEKSILD